MVVNEQSAQFGFEATCKTSVQHAQSNIEINHVTSDSAFVLTGGTFRPDPARPHFGSLSPVKLPGLANIHMLQCLR